MSLAETISQERSLTLADFTDRSLMFPGLKGEDAPAVIQELSAALQHAGLPADLLQFYNAVLNREYLCPTVTEPGWAMPHARCKGLARPLFSVGRWAPARPWLKSPQAVSLVFLFAVPESDARGYLSLISGVARLSKRPETAQQLLGAKDPAGMLAALASVQLAGRAAVA